MLRGSAMNDREQAWTGRGLIARLRKPLRDADDAALRFEQSRGEAADRRTAIVLTTAAVALTLQNFLFVGAYIDNLPGILRWLGLDAAAEALSAWSRAAENRELAGLSFWAGGRVLTYIAIPVLVTWLFLPCRVRDLGVRVRGTLGSAPVYLAMLAVMLPAVWFFSTTDSFQRKYPFYDLLPGEALWPRFYIWELLYAAQFIALEFFFRGFMLHGVKHRFGSGAIYVMMVPYCMIHFNKPLPECFGAIGAGIILGYMSLKTSSIWWGAALHIAVAWTMDALAVMHNGPV